MLGNFKIERISTKLIAYEGELRVFWLWQGYDDIKYIEVYFLEKTFDSDYIEVFIDCVLQEEIKTIDITEYEYIGTY